MGYHANTIASNIWVCIPALLSTPNLFYSIKSLYQFKRGSNVYKANSTGGSSKPYPLMLRVFWVLSNFFATSCALFCIPLGWFFVSSETNIDPWHQTLMDNFDPQSRWCAIVTKTGCASYPMSKLWAYMFFWCKQRTVRPLDQPGKLEKLALMGTSGIFFFSILIAVMVEGDYNTLDGTCQLFVPLWGLILMAGADITLSAIYLYLFIQPLRETIRANQKARSHGTALETVAVHAPSNTAPGTTIVKVDVKSSESKPVLNTALEEVMRKNTKSCVITVAVSTFSLFFMVVSHSVDDGYSRKWVVPMGDCDIAVTALALTHLMYKSCKNAVRPTNEADKGTQPIVSDKHSGQGVSGHKASGEGASGNTGGTPAGDAARMIDAPKTAPASNRLTATSLMSPPSAVPSSLRKNSATVDTTNTAGGTALVTRPSGRDGTGSPDPISSRVEEPQPTGTSPVLPGGHILVQPTSINEASPTATNETVGLLSTQPSDRTIDSVPGAIPEQSS